MTLLVLTSSFPFGTGEEFLEAEASYWPAGEFDICVVPARLPGAARQLPTGIRVDTRLAAYRTQWRKIVAMVFAVAHVLVLRELLDLVRHRAFTPRRVVSCVAVVGQTLLIRRGLRRVLADVDGDVVVYGYWHAPGTYAAALLKRSGRVRVVLSRAHNHDVYESIAPSGWLPLKRQLIGDVDYVWTVSADGRRQLVEAFGGDPSRIDVARLGVNVPARPGPLPDGDPFRVLSVSTCTPIKQVPLIAEAVARLASAHPGHAVEWTHLGDGPSLAAVRSRADELQAAHPLLTCSIPGHVEHPTLLARLADHPYDVLVNASRSEGVPVSIMEAMSYGIPAIAPAVGGVGELVGSDDGWLLPTVVEADDVAAALEAAFADRNSTSRREAARRRVAHEYDARQNYRRFASELLSRGRLVAE